MYELFEWIDSLFLNHKSIDISDSSKSIEPPDDEISLSLLLLRFTWSSTFLLK